MLSSFGKEIQAEMDITHLLLTFLQASTKLHSKLLFLSINLIQLPDRMLLHANLTNTRIIVEIGITKIKQYIIFSYYR